MKIPETLKLSRLLRKDRRGVALVTVLTVMALTTILVLTFFSLATSEHRASNTYSHGLQAQQVAEEAVNLVIAQIREATTIGTSTAWASQPGAIRNWDEGGNPESAFKLYSDDQMKTMDWTDFQTDFLEASNWSSRPSHFVDLNEPVIRGEKVYYPIVHPAASTVPKWPKALGDDDSGVEGFSYNQGDMKLSDAGKIGSLGASISKAEGHVAMPVRWIYQLADGTLGVLSDTPSGGSPESFSFNKISGDGVPSEVNPMVARFAFWADDETSKLNINTAAGGLAWDIPKAGGELDMNMGKYQPAQKEWQRYPGHPASTHLGPALAPGVLDIVNDRDAMEMLYRVVPRIVGGGSESGTRLIDTRNKAEANGLVADKEPLFPTLDDVIMRADREPHQFPDPTGQAIPPKDLSDYLERSKFFVTANSRAPETNMFNLPRVAIWPIYNSSGDDAYSERLTTFDRLIRYCASMGKSDSGYPRHEYIFKRENANSTKVDYQNITRNKKLYSYLQEFLERPIPGYGGTFQGKYGTNEHKQILTEIFDYIRMTNLHDDSLFVENFADAFQKVNTEEHRTYTNARDDNNKAVGLKGHGQVVPIEIDGTKGFGRFYTVSGVQIQVISVAEPDIEGNRRPLHFGSTSYKNRKVYPISTRAAYLNFPPMPFGFEKDMAHYADHEPLWLKDLRENNPTLYEEAFKPENWNWQLAYLDPAYFEALVDDPSRRGRAKDPSMVKFKREALYPINPTLPPGTRDPLNPFSTGQTRLKDDEQMIQGAFLFNLFTPSIGWNSINPDMEIELEIKDRTQFKFVPAPGSTFGLNTTTGNWINGVPFIGFDGTDPNKWVFSTNSVDSAWGGRRYGGTMPFEYLFAVNGLAPQGSKRNDTFSQGVFRKFVPEIEDDRSDTEKLVKNNMSVTGGRTRLSWLDRGYEIIPDILRDTNVAGDLDKIANSYRYDLVTVPFKIANARIDPTTKMFYPGKVDFKGGQVTFRFYQGGEQSEGSAPKKGADQYGVAGGEVIQTVTIEVPDFEHVAGDLGERRPIAWDSNSDIKMWQGEYGAYFNEFDQLEKDSFGFLERNNLGADPSNPITNRGKSDRTTRLSSLYGLPNMKFPVASGRFGQISVNYRPSPFGIGDIVQSVEIADGDARVVAGRAVVTKDELFAPHRYYGKQAMAHSQTNAGGGGYMGASIEKEY
ncbi:MAG TPA: Verru_Chthon cassette protein A, partial [Verrucomicrobiales bacterium]|nr:Verru_Chthon cassette protein A [Verrucomicrobiales bacterium]